MSPVRVWAPRARRVELVTGTSAHPMAAAGGGWWELERTLAPGSDYAFRLDGAGPVLPDPRSPWQPHGVHGPSRTLDHAAFTWTDQTWRGVPLAGSVLYELHVGTFTPEGTFDAAAARLDHLVELGVDAVELLPCAQFSGRHGWGYDGVDLFAVHDAYGGPEGLKRFVDAAHRRGLGVVMDVVHNHLGPDGNHLGAFGPYFTDARRTPWGPAVNLDGPGSDEVRRFLADSALAWLEHYHCDGLRLDAVHALADTTAEPFLEQLGREVATLGARLRRPLFLVAESDLGDPRLVRAREAGGLGLDAMWDDDVHHAVHAALTGERQGYYVDFGPLPVLAKALTRGLVHDGGYSAFRGRRHGRPLGDLPGHRLVVCLHNHDQVGNRARGERLSALVDPRLLAVGAALVLLSPFTPLLFMGEEWGARTPWQFFADLADPDLAAAVRDGRRAEFAAHGWAPGEVPDPVDPATRERSVLDWSEAGSPEGAALLGWYRRMIELRRTEPDLADGRTDRARASWDEAAGVFVLRRGAIALACLLGPGSLRVDLGAWPVEVLAASQPGARLQGAALWAHGPSATVVRLRG